MVRYLNHSHGLASRRIGEEEVIVSPRAGKVWSLNAAGALIWEMADGSRSEEEIIEALSSCRGIDQGSAAAEFQGFLQAVEQRQLIEWSVQRRPCGPRSRKISEFPPGKLAEAPELVHEEELQVLAGACDSSHSGQGAACMLFGSCASAFS